MENLETISAEEPQIILSSLKPYFGFIDFMQDADNFCNSFEQKVMERKDVTKD